MLLLSSRLILKFKCFIQPIKVCEVLVLTDQKNIKFCTPFHQIKKYIAYLREILVFDWLRAGQYIAYYPVFDIAPC